MIKNALMDVGNVLLRLCCAPWTNLYPEGQKPSQREVNHFMQLYALYEVGGISSEEFVSCGMEITGFRGTYHKFAFLWCDIFEPILPMQQFCEWMKMKGIRLILFSNTNALHEEEIRNSNFYRLFDDAIYSFVVGASKPGDGMYEYAISQLKIKPNETLYVDDLKENILTGMAFGFRTFHFAQEQIDRQIEQLKNILTN